MSRVGNKPIKVPEKVKVTVSGRKMQAEGPLGKLDAIIPEGVEIEQKDGVITVKRPKRTRSNGGYQGLARATLANMIKGVSVGYERNLEINGVGYKAELKGRTLILNLGYSHQVKLELPAGVDAVVDKGQTKISVKGTDKQAVGQMAAKIRAAKEPEPYKGKGVKYAEETIRRKVGKAGAK